MSINKYNPKSHAPAVYMPCWLIQVSTNNLSNNAKILYGRLSQWCSENGDVFRSSKQLACELGSTPRTVERWIKELKEVALICTHHPQAGGVNHFTFLYHPWMEEPINKNLSYSSDKYESNMISYAVQPDPYPPSDLTVPPVNIVGTPPSDVADINKKEIKRNKKDLKTLCAGDEGFDEFWKLYPKKKAKKLALDIWRKKKLCEEKEKIIASVRMQTANDDEWLRGYAPNPSTYLNQERWEDDIATAPKQSNKKTRDGKGAKLTENNMKSMFDWSSDDEPKQIFSGVTYDQ